MVRGLRFPQLFVLTVTLLILDLAIPDLIPFIDEILLALASFLLASWKKKPEAGSGSGRVIDVSPDD
jgi:hypothetical protein